MKKRSLLFSSLVIMALSITGCDLSSIMSGFQPSSQSQQPSVSTSVSTSTDSESSGASTSSSQTTSSINPSSTSSTSSSQIAEHEIASFDIYPFNDVHGNVKDTPGKGLGLAKTTTVLKEETKDKNAIFISQGDMWQGSAESNFTKGSLVTEWMNYMNFVSMTVGNHEYDWGTSCILENKELANFPILGVNVLYRSNDEPVDFLDPSFTFTKGGVKFGVIGAIGNCLGSITGSNVNDIYFAKGDALTSLVKAESNKLRNEEHCDFIIYSIHGSASRDSADTYDISLSRRHYVDLVFEGHTHDSYAEKDSEGVYHIQCNGNNENTYKVTVDIDLTDKSYEVKTPVKYDFSYANSPYKNVEEDADVVELIESYKGQYEFAYEVVGVNSKWKNATILRQKIADLYLEAGINKWGSSYNLILGGGYLSCRGSGLAAGEVQYAQLAELFPFDNTIVLCSVPGYRLIDSQFMTGGSSYYTTWSSYGNQVKDNIYSYETYYLVTDTFSSDYSWNYLTVVDTLEPKIYARDLLADYIRTGAWDESSLIQDDTGTAHNPKSVTEALQIAQLYTSASAEAAFFYIGVVCAAATTQGSQGDLKNVRVKDLNNDEEILIYWLLKTADRNPNWTSIDELVVGDVIVFYGSPFMYNQYTPEFSNGTWTYSINGELTAQG